tara:strand:- start:64 stop:1167 length:1104 start_codon:yes stop_codon:yes gene_type:complete
MKNSTMKKTLILLLFPLMIFAQDSTLTGDVDCSGDINSEDASLILQFVTNIIDELPCQDNMNGLTPEQLQEIINIMDEQLSINYTPEGSSNYPIMISNQSAEPFVFTDALDYCYNLEEDGYNDWYMPLLDELTYAASGGIAFPDEKTNNYLWTRTMGHGATAYFTTIRLIALTYNSLQWEGGNNDGSSSTYVRCVRFGEGETSEVSGGSSDSGSSILGNSEQPITMIGPMYRYNEFPDFIHRMGASTYGGSEHALYFFDAVRFCSQLEYDGYNDWHLPSYYQILNYYNTTENLEIPNFNDAQVDLTFWTSTPSEYDDYLTVVITSSNWETNSGFDGMTENTINYSNKIYSMGSTDSSSNQVKCFCVR